LNPLLDGAARVPGAPVFKAGERILVFLNPRKGGDYGITQLMLGAFQVRSTVSGTQVLVRNLPQADAVGAGSGHAEPANQYRDLTKFRLWLLAQLAGTKASSDYWTAEALAPTPSPLFLFETDPPPRWFQFAQGQSVSFYAGEQGEAGLPGGGYAEFQEALNVWNTNPGSTINYVYGGLSSASGGLSTTSGVNEILFNDPDGELGGVYDCATGGLLGYTIILTNAPQQYNGASYSPIVLAETVIRNGAGCELSGYNNANAAEVFGHELGHTLGLAHPCGDPNIPACVAGTQQDNALMRPWMHADGRGAELTLDDQEGIASLYPVLTQGPQPNTSSDSSSGGSDSSGGGAFDVVALGGLLLLTRLRYRRL